MRIARMLVVTGVALIMAGGAAQAQRPLTDRPAYRPPVGFGIQPGLLGGVDPYGFGIESSSLVPSLIIGPVWGLKLDEKQEAALDNIYQEHRHLQWAFMQQMMAENARLEELFGEGKWDVRAIGEAYDRIFTLRRERMESVARMRNDIYNVLTDEQREELKLLRHGKTVPPKD